MVNDIPTTNTTPIKHKSKFHNNHDPVWLSPQVCTFTHKINSVLYLFALFFLFIKQKCSVVCYMMLNVKLTFNKPSSQWVLLTKQSSLHTKYHYENCQVIFNLIAFYYHSVTQFSVRYAVNKDFPDLDGETKCKDTKRSKI